MQLQHDGMITIATGKKRTETKWKNTEMLWSAFLEKTSQTTRTRETYAEYKKMTKTDQDNIKDVGGFVGGTLKDGHRRKGSVSSRSILTLDADHDPKDLIDTLEMLFGFACAVYSTHKHAVQSPRYRLIIPLSRKVSPDEYIALARRISADIDIEIFDDTTYEPERLMYWPSTASDGTFEFRYFDSNWLDVDEVLARYDDWHDTAQWPVSSRVAGIHKKQAEKQGDPLAKDGVIGAFCRAYMIDDVIETFLSDVYSPCEGDRYTYVNGSTVGGLIVYDDKFAYSHHGTDPASGKLCNAFDLVRLHKFSKADEDAKEGTPINRLTSFKAMTKFALSDNTVKKVLGEDQLRRAKEEFVEFADVDENDTKWMIRLKRDDKGELEQTIDNVVIVLENDHNLKKKLALNQFSGRLVLTVDTPWKCLDEKGKEWWTDTDDANLRHYLEKIYKLVGRKIIEDGVIIVVERNSFHPIRDYLDGLEWDGKTRIDTLLIDYLGAEDTKYTRAVTRKAMVAGVARVKRPGTKFDTMLTLCGPQGVGKSTLIRKLGKDWYSDSLTTVQGKEAYEQLAGYWIIEMGEMSAMKKAEVEATKHFLSKVEDVYRPAYGKHTKQFPRQCVFWGTTNKADFLRDETGGRRFWVVDTNVTEPTKSVFKDLASDEVDQLWAEAKQMYHDGETLFLPPEIEAEAAKVQQDHTEDNPKLGMLREYLDTPIPPTWSEMDLWAKRQYLEDYNSEVEGCSFRDRVCAVEIWEELFGGDAKMANRVQINEVHALMGQMDGWKRSNLRMRFGKYGAQKGYVKTN